jgi:hypothetical protein
MTQRDLQSRSGQIREATCSDKSTDSLEDSHFPSVTILAGLKVNVVEFGFTEFAGKLSEFRPSIGLKEAEDADARGRMAAPEEKGKTTQPRYCGFAVRVEAALSHRLWASHR